MATNFKIKGLDIEAVEIPNCPHCKKPTKKELGVATSTLAFYPSLYDEEGRLTNVDRNTHTDEYKCLECKKKYKIKWGRTGNRRSYEYE